MIRWRIIGRSLRRGWPLGLFLVGVGLAFVIGVIGTVFGGSPGAAVRYAGTFLEGCGLLTVALGLREMRKRFKQEPLHKELGNWLRSLMQGFRRPTVVSAQIQVQLGNVEMFGRARLIERAAPDATLEHRLQVLERNLKGLDDSVSADLTEIRAVNVKLQTALDQERSERTDQNAATSRLLKDMGLGGLRLESIGVIWLLLGLLGANLPEEILWGAALISAWFTR